MGKHVDKADRDSGTFSGDLPVKRVDFPPISGTLDNDSNNNQED